MRGGVSGDTVQPAGIMHYGAAFTQRGMLMMRRVMGGGGANYAGRRRGEIEDTGASNIQALDRNHS